MHSFAEWVRVLSVEQWEDFYRGGSLATGPAGANGAYDLEVADAWRGFFASLPRQARLLDIGTGNGVLAVMARDFARSIGSEWAIDATDLALIDPPRHVDGGADRFAGITFHPGIATERLPFPDGHFDAVIGHYALEYADTAAALEAIHRVLRSGGSAQFVLHHAQSALVESARRSLEESDIVLRQQRIHRKLHKLVTLDASRGPALGSAREELVEGIRTIKAAWEAARQARPGGGRVLEVTLDAVQKLLDARRTMDAALVGREVERAEQSVRLGARRLGDLVRTALDADGMAALLASAAGAGFVRIEHFELKHDLRHLVGWQVTFEKP